ncbi:hypothetical protein HDU82_004715 [Entophlyctis luteolus]|nr:hypothetical protein HDU82_004715 [Entophlyctis luteolus]
MGFFHRDGTPKHAAHQPSAQRGTVPPPREHQGTTAVTAAQFGDMDWDALRDVWHRVTEALVSTSGESVPVEGAAGGIFVEQPQREGGRTQQRGNNAAAKAQQYGSANEDASKATPSAASYVRPPSWKGKENPLRVFVRSLLEFDKGADNALNTARQAAGRREYSSESAKAKTAGTGGDSSWDYRNVRNVQQFAKPARQKQQSAADDEDWWISFLQRMLENGHESKSGITETPASVRITKAADSQPSSIRKLHHDSTRTQASPADVPGARSCPTGKTNFDAPFVFPGNQQQPIFPTVQATGSGVVTAFWATIFILLVALGVTLLVLKKTGGFVSFVIKLERVTRLNLSWLLAVWDVEATADYLKANNAHRHTRNGALATDQTTAAAPAPRTPQIEPAADARLFDDPRTHHQAPQPAGQKQQFSSSWETSSGGFLNSLRAFAVRTPAAPRSPPGALPAYAASAAAPPPAVAKPPQQRRPPLGLTIVPRARHPIRADPDFPALRCLPAPVAAALDFAEESWESAVDTAAWGYAAAVVLPREYVSKKVDGAVATGREWVEWGGRYGRQTVKRALGYSDRKQVSFAERTTEKVPKSWFA